MGSEEQNRPPTANHPASTEPVVIDDIHFDPDRDRLMRKLRIKEGTSYVGQLNSLIDEARAIARPRAMYRMAYIDERHEDDVVIDGITFESRVLRINLEDAHRVFAYVATCGTELQEWMSAQDDMLVQYYADVISEQALRAAQAVLEERLIQGHGLGRTSTMSPGSLAEWSIRQQRPLFELLGDPEETIGVRLTDSMLMVPSKSISGVRFPVETTFESCQLCPRERCPSRRAPYDPNLYQERFAGSQ
jgi:hypothetical protein